MERKFDVPEIFHLGHGEVEFIFKSLQAPGRWTQRVLSRLQRERIRGTANVTRCKDRNLDLTFKSSELLVPLLRGDEFWKTCRQATINASSPTWSRQSHSVRHFRYRGATFDTTANSVANLITMICIFYNLVGPRPES